jgi:hypothetical protein
MHIKQVPTRQDKLLNATILNPTLQKLTEAHKYNVLKNSQYGNKMAINYECNKVA